MHFNLLFMCSKMLCTDDPFQSLFLPMIGDPDFIEVTNVALSTYHKNSDLPNLFFYRTNYNSIHTRKGRRGIRREIKSGIGYPFIFHFHNLVEPLKELLHSNFQNVSVLGHRFGLLHFIYENRCGRGTKRVCFVSRLFDLSGFGCAFVWDYAGKGMCIDESNEDEFEILKMARSLADCPPSTGRE
jgi:hypothetical protein